MTPLVTSIRAALATDGYCHVPCFPCDSSGRNLVLLARALGTVYAPPDVDPDHPLIETSPTAGGNDLAPFDRAESIGWHNDFSTHVERPRVSFAYLDRPDPLGGEYGAWRAASCDRVLVQLNATVHGQQIVRALVERDQPFSFSGEGVPGSFRVLERRERMSGRLGFRFYGRALRDGARLAFGSVPDETERAIATVERAASAVGETLAAHHGALLITDNWHSLHDRLQQSVESTRPLRRSLLCFVSELHDLDSTEGAGPER